MYKSNASYSPSTASPLEIFFRYMVMSAGPSGTEVEMLTRARGPVVKSSGREELVIRAQQQLCYFSTDIKSVFSSEINYSGFLFF